MIGKQTIRQLFVPISSSRSLLLSITRTKIVYLFSFSTLDFVNMLVMMAMIYNVCYTHYEIYTIYTLLLECARIHIFILCNQQPLICHLHTTIAHCWVCVCAAYHHLCSHRQITATAKNKVLFLFVFRLCFVLFNNFIHIPTKYTHKESLFTDDVSQICAEMYTHFSNCTVLCVVCYISFMNTHVKQQAQKKQTTRR